jgi:hypothetical protein
MKTNTLDESGYEELIQLSKKITNMEKDVQKELGLARRKIARAGKKQILMSLLREIKASVILEQLEPVAAPEVIEAVRSFNPRQGTLELRKLILDLISGLKKEVDSGNGSNIDPDYIKRKIITLAILIEYLFYFE